MEAGGKEKRKGETRLDVKGETQLQRGEKRKGKLGRATFCIRRGFLCLKSTGIRMSVLCTFLSNSRPTLTPSCNHCNAGIERDERRGIVRRQVLESIKSSTFLVEENFCAGGGSRPTLFCKGREVSTETIFLSYS